MEEMEANIRGKGKWRKGGTWLKKVEKGIGYNRQKLRRRGDGFSEEGGFNCGLRPQWQWKNFGEPGGVPPIGGEGLLLNLHHNPAKAGGGAGPGGLLFCLKGGVPPGD